MSKFYGRVHGGRGEATRCGHKYIKTAAQSWNGSVITELTYNEENTLMVNVSVSSGSSSYGNQIFYGTFQEFVDKLQS